VESGHSAALAHGVTMKKFIVGALFSSMIAAPAAATGGLTCRTPDPRPIELSLVISHTIVSSVVSASLREGRSNVPVRIAQSWLDPSELRLDLVDPNALKHELRLRVKRYGETFDGTLWRGGKKRWVRCRES
jgi:hypothetical protein